MDTLLVVLCSSHAYIEYHEVFLMSTPFLIFFISYFFISYFILEFMYRRSPAESGYLLYYPQFRNICQAGILIYFSEKVAQAVSLQSLAPQPLIST